MSNQITDKDRREFWQAIVSCLALFAVVLIGSAILQSIMEGMPA